MGDRDYRARMFVPEGFAIPPGTNGCPTTDEVRRDAQHRASELSDDIVAAIISVLTRPPAPDETHFAAAARREYELRDIFGGLSAVQAWALGRQLDRDRDGDPIAVAFRRLCAERRKRLRTYLADQRRRTALSSTSCKAGGRNGQDRA